MVLSVDADGCLYRRWCVTSDGVSPHGVAPRGVSHAATPRKAAPVLRGAGSTWFFPAWCTAVRSDASAALLRTCAEDPFRPGLRLRQDRCCQKALFTREKLYQSRSHVQGAPVSATDSPPQAPYALTPTTFTADRQQTCLQHCPSLPALSGCQQRVPGVMSWWLLLY